MQPTPLILKQSLRSLSHMTRAAAPNRTSPILPVNAILSSRDSPRLSPTSVCLRCQFRAQTRFYSAHKVDRPWRDSRRLRVNADKNVSSSSTEIDRPLSLDRSAAESSTENQPGVDFNKQQHEEHSAGGRVEQGGLPSDAESRRSSFARRFGDVMDNMQSNAFNAGRRLNDITGYSSIEKLKQGIQEQENRVRETRAAVSQTKETYSSAITRRSTSQREVNELLQRKHAWSPTDLERFTSLYRSDHANEQAETEAQSALAAAERDAEEAAAELNKNILARYHEEQIWSDKIRRMSTWGTWGLMGVNVLLFLVFQVAVEPWRRQRLVRGFEDKVLDALDKENGKPETTHARATSAVAEGEALTPETTAELSVGGAALESRATTPVSAGPQSPSTVPTHLLPSDTTRPESWKQMVHDLFSERPVSLSQRGLTTIALESAAAGAAVVGVLVAIFRPQ